MTSVLNFGAIKEDELNEWRQWRGPMANGFSPRATPPVSWSETNNVRWKIALPGKGHATPVVAGELVFIQLASPVGEAKPPVHDSAPGVHDSVPVTQDLEYRVMAVQRNNGQIRWSTAVRREWPHEGGHTTGSPASNSPVTDGKLLYAFFGSRGIHCMSFEGRLIWQAQLGRMQTLHAHGEGSSPVLHEDYLIVNWDHQDGSFIAAYDKTTGAKRWQTARDEITSWSTPVLARVGKQTQVIVSATRRIRAYDVLTGKELWQCEGLTDNVVASPILWKDMVVAGNSYYKQAMLGISLPGAAGDISGSSNVVWRLSRLTPYVPSPLLMGDTMFHLRHNQNVLVRLNPATGEFAGELIRLDAIRDFVFASPVGAAGRIYITGRKGTTMVISSEVGAQVLAVNRLNDSFSASAALAGNELYLRGERFLYNLVQK